VDGADIVTCMSDRLDKLLKLHEADPDDAFCTYAIALELAKEGRAVEGIAWLDKTLELEPNHAYAFFHKARLLMEEKQTEAAREVAGHGLEAAKRAGDDKAVAELSELYATLQ